MGWTLNFLYGQKRGWAEGSIFPPLLFKTLHVILSSDCFLLHSCDHLLFSSISNLHQHGFNNLKHQPSVIFNMRLILFIHNVLLFVSYTLTVAALTPNPSSKQQNDAVSLLRFKSEADSGNKLDYSVQTSTAVCKWKGVQCQNNGRVVRFVLEDLNLAGVFAPNTLSLMDQLRVLSLRNNSLNGPIPNLAGLVNLKALFLEYNYFTGVIPSSIASLHRLRTIDLSYNNLSGVIPLELSKLDRLKYLRLDSNRLNGSIPPLNQSSLEIFNVSVNFLTGPVPVTTTLARFAPSLFSINPRLCGEIVRTKCSTVGPFYDKNSTKKHTSPPAPGVVRGQSDQVQQMESSTNSKSTRLKRIGFVIGFSAGLLAIITSVLCTIMLMKRSEKKRKNGNDTTREMMEMAEAADAAAEVMRMEEANELEKKVRKLHQGIALKKSGNLVFSTSESQVYTVEQLMKAAAELLGTGTMGTTYKAVLDNRVTLCVKRLDGSRLSGITNEAFERHIEVVGRLRHPNLVALGAYLQTKEARLLVYDYQPNGSLSSLIHGSKSTMAKQLHWTSCLKIAEDVAQGLCYLHQTCNLGHGNLKSSNILLGSDFEARIIDYGLSELFHQLPDYGDGDSISAESDDIYAFGVVFLELLTGKDASEHPDLMPDDVVKWVKSSRGGGEEEKRLEMMTEVAIACCVRSPELRPTMCQVIKMLQEIKEVAVMEDCGLDP